MTPNLFWTSPSPTTPSGEAGNWPRESKSPLNVCNECHGKNTDNKKANPNGWLSSFNDSLPRLWSRTNYTFGHTVVTHLVVESDEYQ